MNTMSIMNASHIWMPINQRLGKNSQEQAKAPKSLTPKLDSTHATYVRNQHGDFVSLRKPAVVPNSKNPSNLNGIKEQSDQSDFPTRTLGVFAGSVSNLFGINL